MHRVAVVPKGDLLDEIQEKLPLAVEADAVLKAGSDGFAMALDGDLNRVFGLQEWDTACEVVPLRDELSHLCVALPALFRIRFSREVAGRVDVKDTPLLCIERSQLRLDLLQLSLQTARGLRALLEELHASPQLSGMEHDAPDHGEHALVEELGPDLFVEAPLHRRDLRVHGLSRPPIALVRGAKSKLLALHRG